MEYWNWEGIPVTDKDEVLVGLIDASPESISGDNGRGITVTDTAVGGPSTIREVNSSVEVSA